MSAPTPAPGDDRPREGYYPDPSIPGYVRYWNGSSWVPGTSRPAPSDGVPPGTPQASVPGQAQAPALAEETGPFFFDEDPQLSGGVRQVSPAEAQHGSRPEPAAAWGADRSHQSGFGRDQDRRVSWGAPPGTADPRVPRASGPADQVVQPDGRSSRTDGTATIPPADSGSPQPPASGGSVVFRRPTGPVRPAGSEGTGGSTSSAGTSTGPGAEDLPSEGTMTFRPVSPRTAPEQGNTGPAASSAGGGFAAGQAAAAQANQASAAQVDQASSAQAAARPAPAAARAPAVPQQVGGTPTTSGIGGGQPSWAQQVHRLAGEEGQPVAPWKPPVEDIFTAAARRQSATRPAGLGRRLAARLVDTVVLAGVTAVAAVPLGTKAIDHVNEKVDAAKLSGETVTVWLLDGTTTVYLGIVLAVLLVFGVLYDALPTARWGRTLGKKLCGIEVCDIEGHEPPSFGAALRRWLVYAVTGVLGIGVLGVLWCLFDKPWRQCWHDKAAHTFVAAR
ncbi:RDD family protein [Streptomyces sp. NPDC093544]|uniref:RDD family protein n=1 Tax=Streptomyces sp. NPDC093544 TaxID=3155200 RepID=UPI00341DA0F4